MSTLRVPQCAALLLLAATAWAGPNDNVDWPAYLGGPETNHYSRLDQIDRKNVRDLKLAWEYHAGGLASSDRSQIQCNPIIIDGILYASSAGMKFFALDAATGREKWVFNPFEGGYKLYGLGVNRGAVYWTDGRQRRLLVTAASKLYALNADTGKAIPSFGDEGSVDLHDGLGENAKKLFVVSNTPGVIYNDLLILGTRVAENHPAAPGHIRAYNVQTGAIAWTFRTVPRPGEFGYDTWPPDAWRSIGGANAWAGMSVDNKRGLVFAPTGSAAYDFYGGDRLGANLFANCVVALNAATGERVWHYQIVHHDLWDRDIPATPNLVRVRHGGKMIDAVAQITKSAHIFLLDRDTGEPLFPVEERPVSPSELKGEVASPTQPLPLKPAPVSRQAVTEDEVTQRTPEVHAAVLERIRRVKTGRQFIPPSREGTVIFPGFDGGGEWGGAAVDEETGILYVNASEMAWLLTMIDITSKKGRTGRTLYAQHCLYCHGIDRQGDPLKIYPPLLGLEKKFTREQVSTIIEKGVGVMPSFEHLRSGEIRSVTNFLLRTKAGAETETEDSAKPGTQRYVHTGYTKFVDKDGYPAVKPPWGTLNAIDLNTGEFVWKVTLGDTPELARPGAPPTGAENYGGPVVTKGGLLFIAATKDERFRAFDKDTGEQLWETQLPAGGYATPSTYAVNGKQFVVIAAGGGKMGTKSGDSYLAYALPSPSARR